MSMTMPIGWRLVHTGPPTGILGADRRDGLQLRLLGVDEGPVGTLYWIVYVHPEYELTRYRHPDGQAVSLLDAVAFAERDWPPPSWIRVREGM